MKTTTYKCDRCGAEDTNNKIEISPIWFGYGDYITDVKRRAENKEWCLKCRIEIGLQKPRSDAPEAKPIEPEPTLEDMIRMIVRDEIQNG